MREMRSGIGQKNISSLEHEANLKIMKQPPKLRVRMGKLIY